MVQRTIMEKSQVTRKSFRIFLNLAFFLVELLKGWEKTI